MRLLHWIQMLECSIAIGWVYLFQIDFLFCFFLIYWRGKFVILLNCITDFESIIRHGTFCKNVFSRVYFSLLCYLWSVLLIPKLHGWSRELSFAIWWSFNFNSVICIVTVVCAYNAIRVNIFFVITLNDDTLMCYMASNAIEVNISFVITLNDDALMSYITPIKDV